MSVSNLGVVEFDENEALELLYKGYEIKDISLIEKTYDQWAIFWDKQNEKSSPGNPVPIVDRTKQWLVEFADFDVRQEILNRCKDQQEIDRVNLEMDMFEERDLIPVLRLMFYIVDNFRKNNVVWGCGRGSSCSSYVLFKIGIHKIDALKYSLDIKDFLK